MTTADISMNVWLITVGEPLPIDEGAPRLLRAGLLAKYLVGSGHSVTWWTSTYDHQRKFLRAPALKEIVLGNSLRLVLLHGRPYSSNVSIARICNHREIARQFAAVAQAHSVPDVVLCSYPTMELSNEAVRYGKANKVPIVLDVRDLWPDVFLDLAPRWLRPFARIAISPLFTQSVRACRGATAIFGVTDEFRDWGIFRAQRASNTWDATFPMGYPEEIPDSAALREACVTWDRMGVTPSRPVACFFGTFGRQFDLETVLSAAEMAYGIAPELLWVLCGNGDNFGRYRRQAMNLKNVIMPGWVDKSAIFALMQRSSVGLAPYRDTANFIFNLPNKPIEYLSAGLPVVATVAGVFRETIERAGAGISIPAGDAAALAREVCNLVGDADRRARMREAATQLYRKEYVAEVVYGKMIDHLRKLAETWKRGGNPDQMDAWRPAAPCFVNEEGRPGNNAE